MSCTLLLFGWILPGATFAQPIKVKLVNGKTGKPFKRVRVYIVLSGQKQQHLLDLTTDNGGDVRFDSGDGLMFQVRPVGELSCGEQPTDYLVGTVASSGIVTRDDCGHFAPAAVPGQLTYLARPATWWQLFRN